MNNSDPKLVIRRYRPGRLRLVLGALTLALAAGALGLYEWGWRQAGTDYAAAVQQRVRLERQVARLQDRVQRLQEKEARLQGFRSIDEQATKQVRDALDHLQQENLELREELQFYRNIVSPSKGRSGLSIQDFVIDQGAQKDQYHYKLTLIHIPKMKSRHNVARGVISLTLEGVQGGVARQLNWAEVASSKGAGLRYTIKYFKHFEGDIVLPKGFVPHSVTVRVTPRGKAMKSVEKTIQWPRAAG